MAQLNKVLLTIAIPTYNRADLLKHCLENINVAAKGYHDFIEVVISDNSSTDNTEEVVKLFEFELPLQYYKNKENLGFNLNYIKLIDEYAGGQFCWVIGDDDFIRPDAIKDIINVLQQNENLSLLYINYDLLPLDLILERSFPTPEPFKLDDFTKVDSFKNLMPHVAQDGNILMGFISAVVFRTNLIKSVDKKYISKDSWTSGYSLFPHSSFYSQALKNESAGIIRKVLFSAAVLEKPWSAKVALLYLKFLPELYDYYLKQGFTANDLSKHKQLIIKSAIPYIFKSSKSDTLSGTKFKFFLRYIFDGAFYKILLSLILKKVSLS